MSLKPTRFGLSCALTSPMTPEGAMDLPRLVKHARWVLENGCDSITLFGTTGEGASIGLSDRARMFEALAQAGIAGRQIWTGVAAANLEEALAQARMGIEAGSPGLLLAPPFYFKGVSDDALFAWFSRFIEALAAPACKIILYHIPSVTAVSLSVDLVGRLKAAFPGIIYGVKDSSGEWTNTQALLQAHGELAILVGDERQLAKAVRMGGEGTICGLANFAPRLLRPVVHEGRDDPRVNRIVDEIVRYPVIPAVKAMVGHVHGDAGYGPMLSPLTALPAAEAKRLAAFVDGVLAAEAA